MRYRVPVWLGMALAIFVQYFSLRRDAVSTSMTPSIRYCRNAKDYSALIICIFLLCSSENPHSLTYFICYMQTWSLVDAWQLCYIYGNGEGMITERMGWVWLRPVHDLPGRYPQTYVR